ncbi:MAG: class I SAM-dependent methyltransferase [Actinomycetia bacterium]|nr:class I SAM-dependent methyltransferase [Actinomycetes bacterium]
MTARKNTDDPLLDAASLGFAEDFVRPPEPVRAAREGALTSGAPTISPGVAAALTFLTRALDARAVVEIGTGPGVTGLALFAGMNPEGILTSLDADADWQLEARAAFTAAGVASSRARLIAGTALDILPKLRDAAYDLVLVNGDKLEYAEYVAQGVRLLRRGGVLVVNDALWKGLVANPRNDDDETLIIREALQAVQDNDSLTSLVIPLGDGIVAAVKN